MKDILSLLYHLKTTCHLPNVQASDQLTTKILARTQQKISKLDTLNLKDKNVNSKMTKTLLFFLTGGWLEKTKKAVCIISTISKKRPNGTLQPLNKLLKKNNE